MAIYPTFPGGKRKAFTLSYDDGWSQDRHLISLMNQYGIKGTFNLNSGNILFDEMKNPTKIYKGHEVAVHGLTHAYLDRIEPQNITYEIMKDRENLEKVFGGSVRGFAYAHNKYNETTIQILKNCGIKYARTATLTETFSLPSDWYQLNPTCEDGNPKLLELCDTFLKIRPDFAQSNLFYIYGHSLFTDRRNHWGILEELFEKISGRDDVWCATNIEICDYMSAFHSLVMSVDSKYIYNPTVITISLIHNSGDFANRAVEFEIKPGEEMYLR